ncbi:MAG: PRC-barrel domain-containing protein [Methylobacterium mesophilicum]|nr:PRC-barrel domain-containing protein [Methylobacterium mesophilicum]
MIRKLLATTAFATVLATGAFAQDATAPAPAAPAATEATTPAVGTAEGTLATNLIGENVYNGTAENAEKIGDVSDLVLSQDGQIESVVVGVGGFLGIGQKNVALNYKDLSWNERNGDRWLVSSSTKESLQALPEFDRSAYDAKPANTAQTTDSSASSTTAMAPAATTTEPAAPATDSAANNTATNNNMAATPDQTQTAAIDRSTLTEVPADKLTADNLVGTTVYGANDQNVGKISDIVLTADGKVDAVLLDVGGFLGIGAKTVAVGMDKLSFMQDGSDNRYLYTNFTKEQLEAQTAYDAGTYANNRDQQRLIVR